MVGGDKRWEGGLHRQNGYGGLGRKIEGVGAGQEGKEVGGASR